MESESSDYLDKCNMYSGSYAESPEHAKKGTAIAKNIAFDDDGFILGEHSQSSKIAPEMERQQGSKCQSFICKSSPIL